MSSGNHYQLSGRLKNVQTNPCNPDCTNDNWHTFIGSVNKVGNMKYNLCMDELKRLLQDFDLEAGTYPEHELEGLAIWNFINNSDEESWDKVK